MDLPTIPLTTKDRIHNAGDRPHKAPDETPPNFYEQKSAWKN